MSFSLNEPDPKSSKQIVVRLLSGSIFLASLKSWLIFDKFSKKANSDLSKYEIKLVIITKYTPLIKKCGNVEIFSFDELRKYIKNI